MQHTIQHHLDIPIKLPKMNYRYSAGSKGNRNRDILIQYNNGKEFKQSCLMRMRQSILNTTEDYVYPLVYVEFAKEHVYKTKSDRIIFDKDHLLELRYLSNDLRNKVSELKDDVINYCVYDIACRVVQYAHIVKKQE